MGLRERSAGVLIIRNLIEIRKIISMFIHLVFGTIVIFFFISQIIVTSFFYLLSLSLVVFIFLDFLCVGNSVFSLLILTV